ncbi:MAG TPA: hypothetical protein DEV78_02780 [Clostridiales bacterium]|nr:hypothetical protein [Clostridiales bacterium]
MSLENILLLAQLFDLYGPLLSPAQQSVMKEYILNDFTISEIAENQGVSRQAIKDAVSKAEQKLKSYENKLGFLKRLNGEK